MAETRRKRAVAAGRGAEVAEAAETSSSTYALRLNQALEAISAAQSQTRQAAAVEAPTNNETSPRRTSRRSAATVAAPSAARLQAAKAAGLLPTSEPLVEAAPVAPARVTRRRTTKAPVAAEIAEIAEAPAPRARTRRTSASRIDLTSEAPQAPAPIDRLLEAAEASDDADDEVSLDEALESDRRFAALLDDAAEANRATRSPAQATRQASWRAWLAALEKLPPIRLPIGPAIPWKLGLPALIGLVIVMASMSHGAQADSQGVQLPAQETYAVQQTSPLFADTQKDQTQTDTQTQAQASSQAPTRAATIGVQDPTGGFDFVDVAIKLAAVLGLAYGSLLLLKRVGVGGAGAKSSGGAADLKLVSSLALAPNRTVHVISAPGGKSLLVGATPNQVNLIAELGLTAEPAAEATEAVHAPSFLDVLSSKLGK